MVPADFDESDIDYKDFNDTVTSIVQTSFEAVVAEIIDNSLDAEASKIFVEFYGYNRDDFAVIIYDNGLGFRTKEEKAAGKTASFLGLEQAFSLAGTQGEEGKIGKFNIGLKISPLSKCDRVFALCKLDDGKIVHRGLDKPLMRSQEAYGTFSEDPGTKATKLARKVLKSKTNDYRTAIVLYDFKRMPIRNKKVITDGDKAELSAFLRSYYGVIYQRTLEKDDSPIIRIYKDKAHLQVRPLDPFWKDFTPEKIDERLGLPESNPKRIPEKERYLLECFKEWGTVKCERQSFTIEVENFRTGKTEKHQVHVTGYVIPSLNIHSRLPVKYKKPVLWTSPFKGNTSMKLVNLGGLYFYRGDRCICFGSTRTDGSNLGWYTLHEDPEGWLNKTRVMVEFPTGLDEWMAMSATKDCVDPEDDFFDHVKKALNQQISDNQLRAGLGNNKQFFNYNCKKDDDVVVARAQSPTSANPKQINKTCLHCGLESPPKFKPYHHKDTRCPKTPCEICGQECLPGKCEYECGHTDCGRNHKEKDCHLNCEHCDYPEGAGGHGDKPCPNVCTDCDNPKDVCECPCPRGCGGTITVDKCCQICEKPRDDSGECECPGGGKPPSTINIETPGLAYLKLMKGDENNEAYIEKAREHLE